MKLQFTNHAKHRLFLERGISVDEIKKVIREPDNVISLPDGVEKCLKGIHNGTLVVVYKKEKNVYVIITAYFK